MATTVSHLLFPSYHVLCMLGSMVGGGTPGSHKNAEQRTQVNDHPLPAPQHRCALDPPHLFDHFAGGLKCALGPSKRRTSDPRNNGGGVSAAAAPHSHYATHGTINSLQLSAPKYCHSCANSQRQILKYDRQIRKTGRGKYVKWQWQIPKRAGRQRRATPAECF